VVLVGGKAPYFYQYYFCNKKYRKAFAHLGMDQLQIVGVVPTPDFPTLGFEYWHYTHDFLKSQVYALKPDVFLFSAGMMAKYLAIMVKRDGFIGIDIGNVLESYMNWTNTRLGTENFRSFKHPDYDFLINSMTGLGCIVPKKP
jgi:hypothetical protein